MTASSPRPSPSPLPAFVSDSRVRRALGALLPALALALAACTSQRPPAVTSAPTPAPPATPASTTSVRGVIRRDVFVPVGPAQSSRNIRDFAIAPWSNDGGECIPIRLTATGARYESVYYPTRKNAKVLIALTVDSTGHLVHSTETHGVISFRPPPGDTTRAGLDSALVKAQRATRVTSISLDYLTDNGFLMQRGGGQPTRSMIVSTVAVENLPLLDNPAQHARDAARHCNVGVYGEPRVGAQAQPTPGQSSRALMAPDDVARAFYDDLRQREWAQATSLMDTHALGRFRMNVLKDLLGWAEKGAQTFGKQRAAGGSPKSLGWSSARDTSLLGRYDTVSVITRGDSTTIGTLARLPDDTLVARLLAAVHGAYGATTVPIFIGYVTEGDSLAHVVYRTAYYGGSFAPEATQRSMVHLRRVDGRWKIIVGPPVLEAYSVVNAAVNYRPPPVRHHN